MRAEGVPVGSTARGICPFCKGGRQMEASFNLTVVEHGKAKYLCHRSTCGAHGSVFGASSFVTETRDAKVPQKSVCNPFRGATRPLGREWVSELSRLYSLREDEATRHGWLEEVDSGRLVVCIRSSTNEYRGVQLRSNRWSGNTRSRDFRETDGNWMGWFYPSPSTGIPESPTVLVEDVISAAKVAQAGFVAASLMGCNLSLDLLLEGASRGDFPCYLALDRDATGKAIEYSQRYRFLVNGNLIPILLSKDIKYHTEEEIQDMIHNATVRP